MKVEVYFTRTPVGRFGLAYFAGDIAAIEEALADEIEKAGYCTINRSPVLTKSQVMQETGQAVETAALTVNPAKRKK